MQMVARGKRAALGRAVGEMSSAAADCTSTQHTMMAAVFPVIPFTDFVAGFAPTQRQRAWRK